MADELRDLASEKWKFYADAILRYTIYRTTRQSIVAPPIDFRGKYANFHRENPYLTCTFPFSQQHQQDALRTAGPLSSKRATPEAQQDATAVRLPR